MARDLYKEALDALPKKEAVEQTPEKEEAVQQDETANTEEVLENTEEETVEESVEPNDTVEQPKTIGDDEFFNWASEKLNRKVESFEDLVEKEKVVEEKELDYISEFSKGYDKFYKETNRSPEDYLKFQRDLSTLSKEEVIKESLKAENPKLTDAQINRLYSRKYNIDEEMMEEDEIEDVKLDIDIAYNRGLKTLEQEKEKYLIPSENSIASQEALAAKQREEVEAVAKQWAESIAETNKSLSSGIEVDLGEDFKFTHAIDKASQKNVAEIAKDSSMQKWVSKYQNKDGSIDQVALQRDIYIRDNWQRLIKEAVEHAQSKTIETVSKEDRNIDFKSGAKPQQSKGLSKRAQQEYDYLKSKGLIK